MVVASHVSLGIWFSSLLLMSDILIFVFHGNVLEKKGMHGGLWEALGTWILNFIPSFIKIRCMGLIRG